MSPAQAQEQENHKMKDTRKQVALAVQAVESKKGEDVAILEMDRTSGAFTDYFIVCSGTNPRQIQAIADEVETRLTQAGLRPNSMEGYNQAEWVLLDYVDFVVHVFSERARKFYDLERLWKAARRLSATGLARRPTARRAASSGARKKAVSARAAKPAKSAGRTRSKAPAKAAKKRRKSK
jgi:ribosome-associated protein